MAPLEREGTLIFKPAQVSISKCLLRFYSKVLDPSSVASYSYCLFFLALHIECGIFTEDIYMEFAALAAYMGNALRLLRIYISRT